MRTLIECECVSCDTYGMCVCVCVCMCLLRIHQTSKGPDLMRTEQKRAQARQNPESLRSARHQRLRARHDHRTHCCRNRGGGLRARHYHRTHCCRNRGGARTTTGRTAAEPGGQPSHHRTHYCRTGGAADSRVSTGRTAAETGGAAERQEPRLKRARRKHSTKRGRTVLPVRVG